MKSINANDGTMNLEVSFEIGSDLETLIVFKLRFEKGEISILEVSQLESDYRM